MPSQFLCPGATGLGHWCTMSVLFQAYTTLRDVPSLQALVQCLWLWAVGGNG